MKKIVSLIMCLCSVYANSQEGIPFFVNYPASVYQAHNRNFDVVCDSCGNVYFANFEGILHYDYSRWETIYTPGFSRVTRLFRDSEGRIWVGGYNVFGRIERDGRGCITLRTLLSDLDTNFLGELEDMAEIDKRIYLKATSGGYYTVQSDSILAPVQVLPAQLQEKWRNQSSVSMNRAFSLPGGETISINSAHGLIMDDSGKKERFSVTERNGLCSNAVSGIAADGRGNLWGATDNGVFHVFIPSLFSRYTSGEGLKGEVISAVSYKGMIYTGTLQGLYVLKQNTFVPVQGISQACWQLCLSPQGELYAASGDGVYVIRDYNHSEKLTDMAAYSLAFIGHTNLLMGTMDGIYQYSADGERIKKISDVEKVVRLEVKKDRSVWAKTLYGEIYLREEGESSFVLQDRESEEVMTEYMDNDGCHWQTNLKGKEVQVHHSQIDTEKFNQCLYAIRNYVVRVIYIEEDRAAWFGGDFGLIRMDLEKARTFTPVAPRIYLREVCLNRDSVYWGGDLPEESGGADWQINSTVPRLGNDVRSIRFSFATDAPCFTGSNEYRYRLVGYDPEWSSWDSGTVKEYANLSSGTYTFCVRARDIYGTESEMKQFRFSLLPPFYLQWYCLILYTVAFGMLLFLLFKWRMRSLLKEKERLEALVGQRTKQLVQQKNEIEEKSLKLEKALKELGQAQDELVRQEKMATVGKLTQGLIDRILNGVNYINNFSHLTSGLLKDLYQNLESVKELLDEDTYLDSVDVINMMRDNLEKIEEHGSNTTRVLKAMEEILRDRNRQLEKTELIGLCRKDMELLSSYYQKEITAMHIAVRTSLPDNPLFIDGNAEQLGKTIMSLLNNGMYAIAKKYGKKAYPAEIGLALESKDGQAVIRLYDNGVGIEQSILDKIFDPFFTTKTTGEAAGIGLYLSKEIILNHHGQIAVRSEKDELTEFTITLPLWEEKSV